MMAWLSLPISALTPCMLWTHPDHGTMVSHFSLCIIYKQKCDEDTMCASTVSTEASS